jgi:RNA polymerase sigma factor (sigma-70 family)
MVLGVCRHLLHYPRDVEDAFQATFLVLAREANRIPRRAVLASWLYGVAHRVAGRARALGARRRTSESRGIALVPGKPVEEEACRQLQPALHEEVDRLPGKDRGPVVLCYLEGNTPQEAAAALRWPVGTVKGRLARARDLLRARLARRGLAAPAWLVDAALAQNAAPPAVSARLGEATVRAAMGQAAGEDDAPFSARVAALAEGALRGMGPARWKTVAAALLALVGLALVGWLTFRPTPDPDADTLRMGTPLNPPEATPAGTGTQTGQRDKALRRQTTASGMTQGQSKKRRQSLAPNLTLLPELPPEKPHIR